MEKEERIDDLQYKGLKIIQNTNGFCFGIDSILLSNFASEIKKDSKVIDLGTGTGIIGILLCAKTKISKMVGVEIQEEVYKMAKRSIELNHLENKFKMINANIKELENKLEMGTFDAVVTNPPYKKNNTGLQNENEKKLISRHEITANLEDFIKIAAKLLKDKKDFYIVHRPDRLVDIIELLRKYKLEPKKLQLVYPKPQKEPNLLLIKATKNAKPFLKMEKPLYVYKENGEYTDEILKIYGKEN
ncbi:MAG: tRNA1(Val) (adenine(37)-N6)-methyltransferase [Clostridia bacterium]|nr:tRNA1(Val) (adenine(37)-N6)-methyltransferase [Clostridia bacterium]